MKKLYKLYTSLAFFISVIALISLVSDVYYLGRLTHRDPLKKGWTCRCDFRVFWTAGHAFYNYAFPGPDYPYVGGHSRAAGLKDPEYNKNLKDCIGDNPSLVYDAGEPFYHFRYSPLTAMLMVPFAFIPYTAAGLVLWFLLTNLAFIWAILLLRKIALSDFKLPVPVSYAVLWCTMLASLRFYLMNISIGQSDVIACLLWCGFLAFYLKGRDIPGGLMLALIVQFKPIFLPALLYFVFIKRWKLVAATALWIAALLAAPAAFIGMQKNAELLKAWWEMLGMSVTSQLLSYKNQSLTYFIGKSLLSIDAVKAAISVDRLFAALAAVFMTASYAALALFRRSAEKIGETKFRYLEVALLIIISLLFAPLVWIAQFINLMMPAATALVFLYFASDRKPLYAALAAFVVFSVISGTDLTSFIPVVSEKYFVNIAFGTIFLAYALVRSCRRA